MADGRIWLPGQQAIRGPHLSTSARAAVSKWMRLADRTDTGTLTIPDALGGSSATQASAGDKPTFSTQNGLPVADFDGSTNHLTEGIDSGNNQSPAAGLALWLQPDNHVGLRTIACGITTVGASANRFVLQQNGTTLFVDVYHSDAVVRRGEISGFFSADVPVFLTFEFDGAQTDEEDECILTKGTVVQSLSFSDSGGSPGTMPDTLVQPTGTYAWGTQNTTTDLRNWSGLMGPNWWWLSRQLTAAERVSMSNFEPIV